LLPSSPLLRFLNPPYHLRDLPSFPTRRSSDLGLLVVPFTNESATFTGQIAGALTIFVWVFGVSLLVWYIIKLVFGIRVSEEEELDRKSTRLNSSHVKISYAVFCLKKQNHGKLT